MLLLLSVVGSADAAVMARIQSGCLSGISLDNYPHF